METNLLKRLGELCAPVMEKVYKEIEHAAYLDSSQVLKDDFKIKAELLKIKEAREAIVKMANEENLLLFDLFDVKEADTMEIERRFCESCGAATRFEYYIRNLVKFNCLGILQKELTLKLINSSEKYISNLI